MNQLPFERITREVIIKKKADTSDKFGCYPENRKIEDLINYGIINVDKPSGPTSHQVSAYVQKILEINKAGHAGTLDPKVTGVLPVALGDATKIVQLLLTAGKEYIGIMHLHKDISAGQLRSICAEFTGKIKQLPPIKSAVKRQVRERTIYYLEIIEIDGRDALFRTGCQAGTYIRKLVSDIGRRIGGAHMAELRRTKAAAFNEETLATMQDIADAYYYWKKDGNEKYLRHIIQPVENGVRHLPKIWIMDTTVDSLCHGASLKLPGIAKLESGIEREQAVAVMTLKGELVCYGRAKLSSQEMMQEKGIAVKTERVFMKPGVYPRIEKA